MLGQFRCLILLWASPLAAVEVPSALRLQCEDLLVTDDADADWGGAVDFDADLSARKLFEQLGHLTERKGETRAAKGFGSNQIEGIVGLGR